MISETPLHALVARLEQAHMFACDIASTSIESEKLGVIGAVLREAKAALLLTAGPQETEPKMMIQTIPHLCPHCHKPTGGTAITTMASGACGTPFETEVLL